MMTKANQKCASLRLRSFPLINPEVSHMELQVDTSEFIIAHGTSKFLKPDRVAALQRENKPGWESCFTTVRFLKKSQKYES